MKTNLFRIFYMIIFFFIGSGCSSNSQPVITLVPSTLTPSKALPTALVSANPLPTQTENSNSSAWEVKKVCSEKQGIKIDELNLPYGLLLSRTDDPSTLPLLLYPNASQPKLFTTKFKGGFDFAVSKDHKWISFFLPIDEGSNELWIISSDSTIKRKVTTLASASYINWISPNQLLIIGIPAEYKQYAAPDAYKYIPMFLVDVLDLNIKTLSVPPFDSKKGWQYIGVANFDKGDNQFTLFQNVDMAGSYEVFDYSRNEFMPIFDWLLSKDFTYSQFAKIWLSDAGLAVVLPSEKGLEISFSSVANIEHNDNKSIIKVNLPSYLQPITGLAAIPNTNQMLFVRLDDTYSKPFWLFILDYRKKVIYDYCIDLLDVPIGANFSSDGRFAAISLSTQGLIVVNLSNGAFSTLPAYKAIDWLNFSN